MIRYRFTPDGTKAFINSVWGDIFQALERDTIQDCDIFITIGKREIKIPMLADNMETIENTIQECLENTEG